MSQIQLAFTYGGRDPALLDRVLPFVGYLELTPDGFARRSGGVSTLDAGVLEELQALANRTRFIAHGVGLSIGSFDGYREEYLRLLDQLFASVKIDWHSEHLGYTTLAGEFLGTMLTLPRTSETLDMLTERIASIRQRYEVPFLVENVAALLPDAHSEISPAAFLNTLVARTGCGLLLDVYNLECDARNFGLDIPAFLDELELDHVVEIHLARGIEHRGFLMDVHSRQLEQSTLDHARLVLIEAPQVQALTYEVMPEAVSVLGYDRIGEELRRLSQLTGN